MAFVTKEAAFACNYFYGKPGIFAFLLRNPIEVQNNLVKTSNPAPLILSLKREQ